MKVVTLLLSSFSTLSGPTVYRRLRTTLIATVPSKKYKIIAFKGKKQVLRLKILLVTME